MEAINKIEEMFKFYFNFRNENIDKLVKYYEENNRYKNGFVISGVGKNWYIAEKITKTFISLGIKCQALDCVHAFHGDIGMLKDQNVIFLSKSGDTKEMVELAKYLYSAKLYGILNVNMVLIKLNNKEQASDIYFDYIVKPNEQYKYEDMYEFDSRNLVPTLSITIMQLLLDEVGVRLFENDSELNERYSVNHPGGKIGKILGVK